MKKYFTSSIGGLRLLGFFEGISLLILIFVSMPLKYLFGITIISAIVGPIHGALFLFFVIYALMAGMQYNWKFTKTTWKVLVASFVPFGTFYVDHKILKPLHDSVLS